MVKELYHDHFFDILDILNLKISFHSKLIFSRISKFKLSRFWRKLNVKVDEVMIIRFLLIVLTMNFLKIKISYKLPIRWTHIFQINWLINFINFAMDIWEMMIIRQTKIHSWLPTNRINLFQRIKCHHQFKYFLFRLIKPFDYC